MQKIRKYGSCRLAEKRIDRLGLCKGSLDEPSTPPGTALVRQNQTIILSGRMKPSPTRLAEAGFSLLEMTVALFLGALLLTLVAESGVSMLDRWQLSIAERNLRNQISALPLKAHASRRSFTLDEALGSDVTLPAGWTIVADDEIFYADSGICSGGVIEIRSPQDRVWRYTLEAPFCRAM